MEKRTIFKLCLISLSFILMSMGLARAQTVSVSGTVTDASNGDALPGVNVSLKGTTVGAITDLSGAYTIQVSGENAELIFSYVGYATQNILVNGQTTINASLAVEDNTLNEIVVIGYGTAKKGDITSSVSSVKQSDFTKGSVQDVGQLIQGKVAGLTIYSVSGDPTANTQIKLRGNSTLFGTSTNPLILIDNVPGDFNSVAPEDIESVDILKDGSAAAIYGTQGTNGVILITTKRANKMGINSLSYSGYTSTSQISNKLDMCTAEDIRKQIASGLIPADKDFNGNTDWLKEITRTPISHEHNLTYKGGNEGTNYLVNINYRYSEGIFKKSDNKRTNIRGDINHYMFNNKLKINLGLISRYEDYTTTGDGYSFNGYTYRQALINFPTQPIKNADGSWYEQPGFFNYDNPVARLEESNGKNSSQWNRANATITFTPAPGLDLSALMSYSKYDQTRGYYETKNHISTVRGHLNGYASNGTTQSIDRLLELTANYTKAIGQHKFTGLLGYSYKDNDYYGFWQTNTDFPTDQFGYTDIVLGKGIKEGIINAGMGSTKRQTNLIAFFGRATYNFNDKYLLMGSLRYEGASQLVGTDHPWGFFPSISAGWRISNESFLKDIEFIQDLKLRVGYGVTGSQPIDLFLAVPSLAYGNNFYSNGQWISTLQPSRNPNPNLKWEEKKETNIGLDYGFMRGRINGSIDYYSRKIDGLLFNYTVPVPPNLVTTTLANVGVMKNSGLEVLLNIVAVKKTDFDWTTSFNFSTNKNELVSLSNDIYKSSTGYINDGYTGEPIQTYTHRVEEGGPVGNFYGWKVVDVTDDGHWIYEDADGNHLTNTQGFARTDANKKVVGNGLPKAYVGWNNNLRYKNFDLSISMRGAFGFQILNFDRMYLENTKTVQYNRLLSAYDKVFGKAILSTDEDLEFNSYYIEDGDYWKIDNITLGYNFKFGNVKAIKSARIYVSTINTLTLTKYNGIDPEVQIDGLEPGNDYRDKYPTTRIFTFGVNLNF